MLTFNALASTRRAIASLCATTGAPFNLFVVDNDSRDGSRDWLTGLEDERVHVRFAPRNLGVPGGRNALLRTILPHAQDDDFLIFVDNDLEFLPGWREPFERVFERFAAAGIASKQGSHVLVHRDRRQLLPTPTVTSAVDVASGGFACWIKARTARAVGAFDENLGLFWQEDDDYSIRAVAQGHEVFAVPEAAILHHEHASGVALDDLREGGCARNAAYLAHKWRRLGHVDEDGWVVHRQHLTYLPLERRRELARSLGRTTPFLRAEFARVQRDLLQALSAKDPAAEVASWMRPAGALHHAMLAMAERDAAASGDRDLAARSREVRGILDAIASPARWRPLLFTPPAAPTGTAAATSKLCASEDFADPHWRATAELVCADPSGPTYHTGCHENWMPVQVLHGLFELGAVQPRSRGLAVCASSDPIATPLRARILELESRRGGPAAELAGLPRGHFDFAYVVGGPASGPLVLAKLVREVASALRRGGILAIADVFLVAAATPGASPAAMHAFVVRELGLVPASAADFSISDATIACASARDEAALEVPSLLHSAAGGVFTSGVFFFRVG